MHQALYVILDIKMTKKIINTNTKLVSYFKKIYPLLQLISMNEFDLKTPLVPPPTRRIERTIGILTFLDFLFLFFGKFLYETKFNIYITFV